MKEKLHPAVVISLAATLVTSILTFVNMVLLADIDRFLTH